MQQEGSADSGAGDGGGGGGGGAGGSGFDSPNGNGGIGRQIIITGTNTYYAGGGGGGHGNTTSGGSGGGGAGSPGGNGLNATFYGGGGGGGGGNWGAGGSGFVGIVIKRYKYTKIVVSQVQQTEFLNYTNTNGWLLSQVSGGNLPLTLSDLTGTMSQNRISDLLCIPPTLSDLTGTMSKNRISDFPYVPSTLANLSGLMSKNRISDFPTIPDSYTKGQVFQTRVSHSTRLYIGGGILGSLSGTAKLFKISMNMLFSDYTYNVNTRWFIDCSLGHPTLNGNSYCFATVFYKWNGASTHNFDSHIIKSNNSSDWSITFGGSTDGNFWLNIEVLADIDVLLIRI